MNERILMIIAAFDFSDVEFSDLKEIFEQQKYTVDTVSNTNYEAKSDREKKVFCQRRPSEVKAEDYLVVVMVGGYGASELVEDHGVLDILHEASGLGVVIGAIGNGIKVLANSEILRGRKITCLEPDIEEFKHQGINVVAQNVVIDDNIITARDSDDADEFAYALLDAI